MGLLQFNYETMTVENVDHTIREIFADARHEFLMSPIVIRTYGGKSFAGHCSMPDHDTSHARYLRAWNRSQQAANYVADNGYLP